MKKWIVNTPDRVITDKLVRETGLSEFVCRILSGRGIASRAQAELFFNSDELSDPFDIKDMDKAVNAINEAVENGCKIAVYGDYDCDGITSTYMLFSYLETIGAEVMWYIPTRTEGYGLNKSAADYLKKQGAELIITVDNGISAVEEAEYIYELGMKLIITDHHQVPEILPKAEAVVNPHRTDDISSYKFFAGCGVVLKLIMAMEGDAESVMTQYADIAAIGTVSDIVRLDGENRIIVRKGLELMPNTENNGLFQLLRKCGISEGQEITSSVIAFQLGPRINAAGRYESPKPAMELFLCEDGNAAAAKAGELCEMNERRQQAEAEIIREIEEQIKLNPDILNRRILIVSGENWNHGIIGIASAKLLHKYGKPNIVITKEGEISRGSARSTDDLSLFKMLDRNKELLIRFGGHTKAAGLTIATDRIDELCERLYAYCDENSDGTIAEALTADMEITPSDMTVSNVELIENLEPFGEGNQEPLFLLRNCIIRSKKSLKDGKYVSFEFAFGDSVYRAIYFGSTFEAFGYSEGDAADIIANLSINEYKGTTSIKVMVRDVRYSGFRQERYFAAKTAYEDYRGGRVEKRLLCRMAPTDEELRKVYDILRRTEILSKAELLSDKAGINYCKFRIILDIFAEFGLAEADMTNNTVKRIPAKAKADLSKSKVLSELRGTAEKM